MNRECIVLCSVRCELITRVVLQLQAVALVGGNPGDKLIRKRRHWITPPIQLTENVNYQDRKSIHSDLDNGQGNVLYSLKGIGASRHPFHVFVVDANTGLIRVTRVLDREDISIYNLTGVAQFRNGTVAEDDIDIVFKIVDENDNAPVFVDMKPGEVEELSPVGTSVMQVLATDADEPENNNTLIAYSIIDQKPPDDMFYMLHNGSVYVKNASLDREKTHQYILTVKGQDQNGEPHGKTATSTVTINVRDVNDNPPTLEKDKYVASINENTQGVEVLRIKAEDLDQNHTGNWDAVFEIVEGNDDGLFSIKTDPNTNEGILMLDKVLQFYLRRNRNCLLKVWGGGPGGGGGKPGSGGGGGKPGGPGKPTGAGTRPGKSPSRKKFKTYPIKIDVKDLPDPPRFSPKVKDIPVSEGGEPISLDNVVATYPAIDGDTGKPAQNVKYAKGSDPDNWISIDPETAEIRLNKIPDRESPSLVNGTYIAKILAISEDTPAKTATGTIAIQVEDVNDNCPVLTNNFQNICTSVKEVIVTGMDEDGDPNGAPLDFAIVPENTQGKWQLEHLNGTAAILRAEESVWPGHYEVEFVVKDRQGFACPQPQILKIQACVCEDGVTCSQQDASSQTSKEVNLGSAAIGVLLLGLLLLLLIPLLMLFCQCGDTAGFPDLFTEMPFDTKTRLINYHTEHLGEKPVRTTDIITMGMGAAKKAVAIAPLSALDFHHSVTSVNEMNGGIFQEDFTSVHGEGMQWMNQIDGFGFSSETEGRESHGGEEMFDLMSLPDHFLDQYYSQVTSRYDDFKVKDNLMMYDDEGKGSSAGSVGCCSLLESDDDLQFLDDLGLKFKTLAELCGGQKIPVEEVKEVRSPPPSSSISSAQTSVSSVVVTQQLPPPPKLQPTTPKPMHYVIQPQLQNTLLLAEAPAANIQGMVLVHNAQSGPSPGVVIQGGGGANLIHTGKFSNVKRSCPNLVQAATFSDVYGGCANLIQTSNFLGSMKMRRGSQTCFVQEGTVQPGGISGSQKLLERLKVAKEAGRVSQKRSSASKVSPVAKTTRSLSVGATTMV
uniref:Desmoglein-2-like n=1 Tax=Acanthochromis polyacanthus TaxID=80966 RepID=A0A3Q1FEA0_9TELE